MLIIFYQRDPHGACLLKNTDFWEELFYLDQIGPRLHCSACSQYADMACFCKLPDNFSSWADNAEYPFFRVYFRKIVLLDGAQGLCRGRIAGKYHERAIHPEEPFHAF